MSWAYLRANLYGQRRLLVGAPIASLGLAAVAWAQGGAKTAVFALWGLAAAGPLLFASMFGAAAGGQLLCPPGVDCDEPLPLSLRRRCALSLAAALATTLAASLFLALAAAAGTAVLGWPLNESVRGLAGAVGAGILAAAYAAYALVAGGGLVVWTFAYSLQPGRNAAAAGTLAGLYGYLAGVVTPLAVAAALWVGYPGKASFAAPAAALLLAAYAVPALRVAAAVRLARRQPGRWWWRAETAATAAAFLAATTACWGWEQGWTRRLDAWPTLRPPYEGRVVERAGGAQVDLRPPPGGTLVGFGDGALVWLSADGRRVLARPARAANLPETLARRFASRGRPRASYSAGGSLWLIESAGSETDLWAGAPGAPLRKVRSVPSKPDIRAVFENERGGVELLARARDGRWFRGPVGREDDPPNWASTTLSVSTATPSASAPQRLADGSEARWIDDGSSMTLDVADGAGRAAHLLLTSAQLRTLGGGHPQPSALRFDGRYVWLLLAGRVLAKAEPAADGARLVAQWDLPGGDLPQARGKRSYRLGADGLFVGTRRGVELLDWEGRQRLLLPGED